MSIEANGHTSSIQSRRQGPVYLWTHSGKFRPANDVPFIFRSLAQDPEGRSLRFHCEVV